MWSSPNLVKRVIRCDVLCCHARCAVLWLQDLLTCDVLCCHVLCAVLWLQDLLTTSFKMSDDAMMDRIVLAFVAESESDYLIGFKEFVTGMSVAVTPPRPHHKDTHTHTHTHTGRRTQTC
jgi:hypothetical protein